MNDKDRSEKISGLISSGRIIIGPTESDDLASAVLTAAHADLRLVDVLAKRPSDEVANTIDLIGERLSFSMRVLAESMRKGDA